MVWSCQYDGIHEELRQLNSALEMSTQDLQADRDCLFTELNERNAERSALEAALETSEKAALDSDALRTQLLEKSTALETSEKAALDSEALCTELREKSTAPEASDEALCAELRERNEILSPLEAAAQPATPASAAPGGSWRLLEAPGCFWMLLEVSGDSSMLLEAPGSLEPSGCV